MSDGQEQQSVGKMELIATKSFTAYEEMYRVVDFLNKSLKDKNLMFGLTKDRESGNMTITVYEV
ncbi:MAG: YpmA family protein [Desulfocucumaceae bacterium]